MATTTYEALRDAQIAAIKAIAPAALPGRRFLVNLAERDFRAWADKQPQTALRWFTVKDLFDDEPVEASNLDFEPRNGRGEIVVAYPRKFDYGPDNMRDMNDVIRRDRIAIVNAAGYRGHANFTDATVYDTTSRTEEGDAVVFLVLEYAFYLLESVQ